MAMYRCQAEECSEDPHERLIFDFEVADGEPGICPKCGADARLPEYRHTVIKLETLHLLVKDKKGPVIGKGSRYRVACDPAKKVGDKCRATGEPSAVNCRACKASADFPAELRAMEVPPEGDMEIEIDRDKQVITKKDAPPCGGCK